MDDADQPRLGKLWPYFAPLYAGHVLAVLGLLPLLGGDVNPVGLIVAVVGFVLLIVATVYLMVLLYRIWKLVIRESRSSGLQPSIDSPGKAIGYLYIPLFNFYWVFVAVGKLPGDLNALAAARKVSGTVPVGLGYAVAILSVVSIVPFVGYVTSFAVSLVLMPLLVVRALDVCGKITTRAGSEAVELADAAEDLASIRHWPDLFRKHGVNARVGVAFWLALVAGGLVWIFRFGTMSVSNSMVPILLLADVVIYAVAAVAYVVVNSVVRKVWLLPPVWGFAWLVLAVARRAIHRVITAQFLEPEHVRDIVSPSMVTGVFLWGILFMVGLIVATRVWGVRIWSLSAGLVSSYLVWLLTWETVGSIVFEFSFGIDVGDLAISVVNQAITGFALFVGFLLQARAQEVSATPTAA